VLPNVALGVKFGRLFDTLKSFHLRQDLGEEVALIKEFKSPTGCSFRKHADKFFPDSFSGDARDGRCQTADSGKGGGFDGKAETGSKAHCAQHPEVIFFKAAIGITDGADDLLCKVGAPVDKVEHLSAVDVLHKAIDCEIAPLGVKGGIGFETNYIGSAAIGIGAFAAERSDFDVNAGSRADEDNSKMGAYRFGFGKELKKSRGGCVGADVVVFR
jgi:hypothetical protein